MRLNLSQLCEYYSPLRHIAIGHYRGVTQITLGSVAREALSHSAPQHLARSGYELPRSGEIERVRAPQRRRTGPAAMPERRLTRAGARERRCLARAEEMGQRTLTGAETEPQRGNSDASPAGLHNSERFSKISLAAWWARL